MASKTVNIQGTLLSVGEADNTSSRNTPSIEVAVYDTVGTSIIRLPSTHCAKSLVGCLYGRVKITIEPLD